MLKKLKLRAKLSRRDGVDFTKEKRKYIAVFKATVLRLSTMLQVTIESRKEQFTRRFVEIL